MKVIILGCGASGGVPMMGCQCAVCTSSDPKNKRSRVSIVIESATTRILVDTSPDLREQCLKNNITKVDAIIFTHAHADHLHGIDDVRAFNFAKNAPLDVYSDAATIQQIQERFGYTFLPPKPFPNVWYRPALTPHSITDNAKFMIGDIAVQTFPQIHGQGRSLGLRFGKFAYSTDTNMLPDAAFAALQGVETWVVDCLRYEVAPTHAYLDLTREWIARVQPQRAYLTHMNHELEYTHLCNTLPAHIRPAYDGLVLQIED